MARLFLFLRCAFAVQRRRAASYCVQRNEA
jgi:hypothetical protein